MNTKTITVPSAFGRTTRRQALKGLGAGALGLTALGMFPSKAFAALSTGDIGILNFALNLEYLEAEFYTYATTGKGLEAAGIAVDGRGTPGGVNIKPNPQVPFSTPAIQQYAQEITADEQAHVKYLRRGLGGLAVARPAIDLKDSFTAAAQAAGLIGAGDTFDPFANELSFLLAAFIFEDVGVTAYTGAVQLLNSKAVLLAAARIMGAEAYHASNIRTKIFEYGGDAQNAAQKISDLRDVLSGAGDDDQGVVLNGVANIIPLNADGLISFRTARLVLNIVYFGVNAAKGGFYPNGINAG
ncbi:MAG: ferritin-like domain-containing protein [Verrucomicrobiota bacterium]|nr:ferritin-like domain-containing protein [Verrucomicrobiota bacterium]